MPSYELHPNDFVKRTDLDRPMMIPPDPENSDFIEFLAWLSEGNEPVPYVAPVVYPIFVPREFFAFFTQDEKYAIKEATLQYVTLGIWYDEMWGAQYITAEDPDTLAGLEAMVQAGFLTDARRHEILELMQPV